MHSKPSWKPYDFKVNGTNVRVVGDPHLGRKFLNGVPLERRGEREALQLKDFSDQLSDFSNLDSKPSVVIVAGDLFDKFNVDANVLLKTHAAIAGACRAHPDVFYFILMGNHDISRNKDVKSSFDVLATLMNEENLEFIEEAYLYEDNNVKFFLHPYSQFEHTKDIVKSKLKEEVDFTVGHWDVEAYGDDDHNVIPYVELSKYTSHIITGHIHSPEDFMVNEKGNRTTRDDQSVAKVKVVGSLQPYTFAEDPYHEFYETLDLNDFNSRLLLNESIFHDKCVRVVLKQGEEAPTSVDCLQFSYKYEDNLENEEVEVQMEKFSFKSLFEDVFKDVGFTQEQTEKYWKIYREEAADDQ